MQSPQFGLVLSGERKTRNLTDRRQVELNVEVGVDLSQVQERLRADVEYHFTVEHVLRLGQGITRGCRVARVHGDDVENLLCFGRAGPRDARGEVNLQVGLCAE